MRTLVWAVVAASVVAASVVGCGGGGVVAKPVGFSFANVPNSVGFAGTSGDDVWHVWADGKSGQQDPWDLHVDYWDGTTSTPMPAIASVFTEGACGLPSSFAAVSPGELWMGSFRSASCGFGTNSFNRLFFGRLKKDGSWEDHSSDFPIGSLGTYKAIDLIGRNGVLFVAVTFNVAGPSTYKLYRYAADGTHTEVPLPSPLPTNFSPTTLRAIGADELVFFNFPNGSLYKNGAWTPLASAQYHPAALHVNTGGERWSFDTRIADGQVPVVYRFDGSAFAPVNLNFAKQGDVLGIDQGFIPLTVVPRGGGKLTYVLLQRSTATPGEFTFRARDFDGSVLGDSRAFSASASCGGVAKCEGGLTESQLLEDGTVLLWSVGRWLYALDASTIP